MMGSACRSHQTAASATTFPALLAEREKRLEEAAKAARIEAELAVAKAKAFDNREGSNQYPEQKQIPGRRIMENKTRSVWQVVLSSVTLMLCVGMAPAPSLPTVIDFEDLSTGGIGEGTVKVSHQYDNKGSSFRSPRCFRWVEGNAQVDLV